MKKIVAYLFVLSSLWLSFPSLSSDGADSIKSILSTTLDDSTKAVHLLRLADEYQKTYYDSALLYATEALKIGKENRYLHLQGQALNSIALSYKMKGLYKATRDSIDKALNIFERIGDKLWTARSHNIMGRSYYAQGRFDEALSYYLKALNLHEEIDNKEGIATEYTNISNIYYQLGNSEKDLEYNLKSLEISRQMANKLSEAATLNNIGHIYMERGEYEKALVYLDESAKLKENLDHPSSLAVTYVTLGETYYSQGDFKRAIDYLTRSLDIFSEFGNKRGVIACYNTLSMVYASKKNLGEAIRLGKRSLDIALEVGAQADALTSYMHLSDYYASLGNFQRAYNYQGKFLELYKKLNDDEKNKTLIEIQQKYESQARIKEIDLLRKENEISAAEIRNKNLLNFIFIISIVAIALILVAGIFVYWNKVKANKRLTDQYETIRKQNEDINTFNQQLTKSNKELENLFDQKQKILSVVAHDLKTPLNQIRGLMDILFLSKKLDDDQKEQLTMVKDITENGNKLIDDLLRSHGDEEGAAEIFKTKFDVCEYIDYLVRRFNAQSSRKGIKIVTEYNESSINICTDQSHLKRVFDNLLSNALKYSFADSIITVSIVRKNNRIDIGVKDQGQGISESDQMLLFQNYRTLSAKPTGDESATGLGLSITKTLVTKLGGYIKVKSKLGKGSEFIVSLPFEEWEDLRPEQAKQYG
ncbi:MAG: tetratricopeptide repeat-containing sensor histidine kinase [Bacteroidota bacterium]